MKDKLSKQRRYQIAHRAQGKCHLCSKDTEFKATGAGSVCHCTEHRLKRNAIRVKYYHEFEKVRREIDKAKLEAKSDKIFG